MKNNRPQAFTLVELLVVITIIGMLMALLVPAVGAARAAARQAQCSSNMGQVAKALLVYESRRGELPGRVNDLGVNPDPGSTMSARDKNTVSWVATLLPELERSDVYDFLRTGLIHANTPLDVPRLDIVICPADVQASGAVPGLSFVANAGHWDMPADSLPGGDYQENGIFFGHPLPSSEGDGWTAISGPTMRMDQVQDGATMTVLLSENVQAGIPDSPTDPSLEPQSWLLSPTEQGDGFVWFNQLGRQAQINQGKDASAGGGGGGRPLRYDDSYHCRPSSNHADGVNVVFCDGHTQFIRDDIEYHVYFQLMTPHGKDAKLPPSGTPAMNAWRAYLLDEADYR